MGPEGRQNPQIDTTITPVGPDRGVDVSAVWRRLAVAERRSDPRREGPQQTSA